MYPALVVGLFVAVLGAGVVSVFIVLAGDVLVVCHVCHLICSCSCGCWVRAGDGMLVVYPALVLPICCGTRHRGCVCVHHTHWGCPSGVLCSSLDLFAFVWVLGSCG